MVTASLTSTAPLMLGILVGVMISVVAWGVWNSRKLEQTRVNFQFDMRDEVIIGLLILAAFGLGAFLTYILLSIHF